MSLTALNQGVGKAALLLGAPEKTLSLPLFHFLGASHIPWLMASSPSRQTSKPVIYQLSPKFHFTFYPTALFFTGDKTDLEKLSDFSSITQITSNSCAQGSLDLQSHFHLFFCFVLIIIIIVDSPRKKIFFL